MTPTFLALWVTGALLGWATIDLLVAVVGVVKGRPEWLAVVEDALAFLILRWILRRLLRRWLAQRA